MTYKYVFIISSPFVKFKYLYESVIFARLFIRKLHFKIFKCNRLRTIYGDKLIS